MPINVKILLETAASIHDDLDDMSVAVKHLRQAFQQASSGTSNLSEIEQEIAIASGLGRQDHLLVLLASLEHLYHTKQNDSATGETASESSVAARKICDFAAKSIAPIVVPPKEGDESEDYHPTAADVQRDTAAVAARCQLLAEPGLAVIKRMLDIHRLGSQDASDLVGPQVLVTVVAYVDPKLPWTTPAASRLAAELIQVAVSADMRGTVIVDQLLKDYLRPLFSKSKPTTITDSGRKAHFAEEPDSIGVLAKETRAAKPWKHVDLRAIPAFAWALDEADKDLMNRHWPLCTPVLLALLDDGDIGVKHQALNLLVVFIGKIEPKTLINTGLDSVVQDAVFPALMTLPSVTPEADCLRILGPAYDALITLSRVTTAAGKQMGTKRSSKKMIDKILREGVFASFFYARENIRIVNVLLTKAGLLVQEMGINSVKHLKDLIPMLTSVMEEPFAMAHVSSLIAAIDTMQVVIANCWPRLGQPPWRDAIIKALVVCWMRASEDDGSKQNATTRVQTSLAKTAKMLAAVVRAEGVELTDVVAPLMAQDASLGKLFEVSAQS